MLPEDHMGRAIGALAYICFHGSSDPIRVTKGPSSWTVVPNPTLVFTFLETKS